MGIHESRLNLFNLNRVSRTKKEPIVFHEKCIGDSQQKQMKFSGSIGHDITAPSGTYTKQPES